MKPTLEHLEARDCPSSVSFTDGDLTVTGDLKTANVIRYAEQNGVGSLYLNGATTHYDAASVTSLKFTGGNGRDDLTNFSSKPSEMYGLLGSDIYNGGTGNDVMSDTGGLNVFYDDEGINDITGARTNLDRIFTNVASHVVADNPGDFVARLDAPRAPVALEGNILYVTAGDAGSDYAVTGGTPSDPLFHVYSYGVKVADFSGVKMIVMQGGDGDDKLQNYTGNGYQNIPAVDDFMEGGAGNDFLAGGYKNRVSVLLGDEGSDHLIARGTDALLFAGPDDNVGGDSLTRYNLVTKQGPGYHDVSPVWYYVNPSTQRDHGYDGFVGQTVIPNWS